MPELICAACVKKVNEAYDFKKQCERNDVALRESVCRTADDDGVLDDLGDVEDETDVVKSREKKLIICGEPGTYTSICFKNIVIS